MKARVVRIECLNFATVKPKTLKLCKMIRLAALVYMISLISLKTWPNKKVPDGHIRSRCIKLTSLKAYRDAEFKI